MVGGWPWYTVLIHRHSHGFGCVFLSSPSSKTKVLNGLIKPYGGPQEQLAPSTRRKKMMAVVLGTFDILAKQISCAKRQHAKLMQIQNHQLKHAKTTKLHFLLKSSNKPNSKRQEIQKCLGSRLAKAIQQGCHQRARWVCESNQSFFPPERFGR